VVEKRKFKTLHARGLKAIQGLDVLTEPTQTAALCRLQGLAGGSETFKLKLSPAQK
jgi:hypothetical protein